jgi:hypothetical protein
MEVLADGARRDLNGQLQVQPVGYAFLSPGRGARRELETSTKRRMRSHATEDSVVKLCVSGWKTEPGMKAQFYTLHDVYMTANRRLDEISADHS